MKIKDNIKLVREKRKHRKRLNELLEKAHANLEINILEEIEKKMNEHLKENGN